MNSESPSIGCRWLSVKEIRRARRIPATIAARAIVAFARSISIAMLLRYAADRGIEIRGLHRRDGFDGRRDRSAMGQTARASLARAYVERVFERYWREALNLEDERAIAAVLAEIGASASRIRGIREKRRTRRARAHSVGASRCGRLRGTELHRERRGLPRPATSAAHPLDAFLQRRFSYSLARWARWVASYCERVWRGTLFSARRARFRNSASSAMFAQEKNSIIARGRAE